MVRSCESLRAVRTTMKRWSEDKTLPIAEPAAALRLAVKKAELDAERIEHEMLADWAANSRSRCRTCAAGSDRRQYRPAARSLHAHERRDGGAARAN